MCIFFFLSYSLNHKVKPTKITKKFKKEEKKQIGKGEKELPRKNATLITNCTVTVAKVLSFFYKQLDYSWGVQALLSLYNTKPPKQTQTHPS